MTVKHFITPYLLYMTVFHVLYWASIIGLHTLTLDLQLARAVLSDGLVYMMVIFLPIANSGLSSLKVLLLSVPVIMVCVGLKYAISASVFGYEHYSYSFDSAKAISEVVVSLLIHLAWAALAFMITNKIEPKFKFFRQHKVEK